MPDSSRVMMVGARAVAVDPANFQEPLTSIQVLSGIRDFMRQKKISDVCEIGGSVRMATDIACKPAVYAVSWLWF